MKVIFDNGLYIATFKHRDGSVCMGFAPTWIEAFTYCAELVTQRDMARYE
jgi:hypothetical protein